MSTENNNTTTNEDIDLKALLDSNKEAIARAAREVLEEKEAAELMATSHTNHSSHSSSSSW